MPSLLALISSPPATPRAQRALALARAWRRLGCEVTLALVQDGVLAALAAPGPEDLLGQALAEGAACYYLEEDLSLRGLAGKPLLPQAQPMDYPKLVDLILGHDRALGAF